ncbi:MAG: hypothetical protein ABII13_04315 [Patescibacteria group bacterium]
MIYWIILPIVAASFGFVLITVFRHWKEIRLLNPESIKEERTRQARGQIIEQRFFRVKTNKLAPFKALFKRGAFFGKKKFHSAYIRLVQLDRFYKQSKTPLANVAPSKQERVKTLLDEARSLARDTKWADSERRFLEVLSSDNRNIEAYKGLAGIYLKQKMYDQAKETFEFLVNTKKADDICYAGLAEIEKARGNIASAEKMLNKALELQPKLAHRYAELASFYLEQDNSGQAWPLAKKAAELEPRSVKFMELSFEAALRADKPEEAKRRYDKMRLLSEDKPKLQALKERLEEHGKKV